MNNRCEWAANGPEIYKKYHDEEWGVPVYDDIRLFEFLVLESAQAGLSWLTILKRREGYRKAFAGFDPELVADFDEKKIAELMDDERIIRNSRKIKATINNAKAFLCIQKEFGSFSNYISWSGNYLCPHAGNRYGQRSCNIVLSSQRIAVLAKSDFYPFLNTINILFLWLNQTFLKRKNIVLL